MSRRRVVSCMCIKEVATRLFDRVFNPVTVRVLLCAATRSPSTSGQVYPIVRNVSDMIIDRVQEVFRGQKP